MSADLYTDPTPVPAGSWVTIGFSQNLLGALNVFTSWTDLANQWVANLPTTWPTQQLVINDSFLQHNAIVQVMIPNDSSLGEIASAADALSPDVSILRVINNGGGPASASTLATQAANNAAPLTQALAHPFDFLSAKLQTPVIIGAVVLGVWFLYDTGLLTALAKKAKKAL